MFKIASACMGALGGAYFINSKEHYMDIDFDLYHKFYHLVKQNLRLMGMNMMYTIDRESYIQNLCGEIDGVFLPSIIGLEEGYDANARHLESLFGIGFGFVEAGSLSESPLYKLDDDSPLQEGNILLGKANLKSFKSKHIGSRSHLFPVGVSLRAGKEVREMMPILAENDFLQGCEELIEIVDYFVINFTESNSLNYLLKEERLQKLIEKLKQKRSFTIGVSALLQHEETIFSIKQEKRSVNQVYASELFGAEFSSLYSEAFVPKIYVKVDEKQHSLPILLELAKSYKEIGLEGLVIRTNNLSTIQKIASLTQGKLPLIISGTTSNGIDIINRVKSGAWAIQLGLDLQESGPKIVEKLLNEVKSELSRQNVKNITELRGVNVN